MYVYALIEYVFFSRLQLEIKILRTSVFVDPYEEADAQVWIQLFVQTV